MPYPFSACVSVLPACVSVLPTRLPGLGHRSLLRVGGLGLDPVAGLLAELHQPSQRFGRPRLPRAGMFLSLCSADGGPVVALPSRPTPSAPAVAGLSPAGGAGRGGGVYTSSHSKPLTTFVDELNNHRAIARGAASGRPRAAGPAAPPTFCPPRPARLHEVPVCGYIIVRGPDV